MRDPVYTYCREALPPSTVDKAVSLSFTRPGASNLALARGNVLELYEVELVMKEASGGDGEVLTDDYLYSNPNSEEFDLPMITDDAHARSENGRRAQTKQPRLHLINRWSLHGRIMDIQAVSCNKSRKGADRLLLSFTEAKMSLVAFDVGTQSLVTESIHYYEHEHLMQKSFDANQACVLRLDPEGRCVAMRIYGDQVAILPLVASNDPISADGAKPYASSFVVDLQVEDVDVRNIHDFVFLKGYLEPTLAILHEQDPTWPGLLESEHDTSSLTVVSLDLSSQSVSVLNSASRLPSDSQTLAPIPEPIGGVLVFATNSISHVVNGAISCLCTLNKAAVRGIGVQMSNYIDPESEYLGLVLSPRASTCVLISPNTLTMWTQHGSVFLLQLVGDGRLVKRIRIQQIAGPNVSSGIKSPIADSFDDFSLLPSCSTELRPVANDESEFSSGVSLFFVGGRSGRSLLLGIERSGQSAPNIDEAQKNTHHTDDSMDIDAELYGTASSVQSNHRQRDSASGRDGKDGHSTQGLASTKWTDEYRISVHDELLGTGPIVSMEMGHAMAATNISASPSDEDLELVTCTGNEWRGCLRVQQRHIRPDTVASFELPGPPVRKVWTVRCLKEYNIGGVMQATDSGSLADLNDTFMVISRDDSSAVFAAGDELCEMERTGFYTSGPTIEVGEIFDNARAVQVYASGLRLLNSSGREMQSIAFDGDQMVVSAEISDPYVLLRMENGLFLFYEAKRDTGKLEEATVPQPLRHGHVAYASFFRDKHRVLVSNKDWAERNKDMLDEQAMAKGGNTAADEDFDSLYADASAARRRKRMHGRSTAKRRAKRKRGGDIFDELYEEDDDDEFGGKNQDTRMQRRNKSGERGGDRADDGNEKIARIDREEEITQEARGEDPRYLLVLFTNGNLSIFRLPHFDLLWTTPRFNYLLEVLSSVLPSADTPGRLSSIQANNQLGDDGSSSSGSGSSSSSDSESDGEDLKASGPAIGRHRSGPGGSAGTHGKSGREPANGSSGRQAAGMHSHSKRIDQFQLVQLGGSTITNLHLVTLTAVGEIAVYRAFEFCPKEYINKLAIRESSGSDAITKQPATTLSDDAILALRFTRVQHDVLAYEPDYERKVQQVQAKQKDAYFAWEALNESKLAERIQEEKLVRERARINQQHEDPAVIVDWDEDSENEQQDDNAHRIGSSSSSNSAMGVDSHENRTTESSLEMVTSFAEQPVVDDLYADPGFGLTSAGSTINPVAVDPAAATTTTDENETEQANSGEYETQEGGASGSNLDQAPNPSAPLAWTRKLVALDNVGGYPAVFISGLRPVLVVVGTKRYARVHPLRALTRLPKTLLPENAPKDFDAKASGLLTSFRPIVGLARFHSSSCQHGFVALTQAGALAISMLPTSVRAARGGIEYDAPWPVRCIPVGTAHPGISTLGGVAFHPTSGSYAAISTTMVPFFIKEPYVEIAARHAKELEEESLLAAGKDPSAFQSQLDSQQLIPEHSRNDLHTTSAPPLVPHFYMDLLSPVTWETVDSFEFGENEHIVEMRTLVLESSQALSGSKPFLCVATGFVLGEDVSSRGRVYIFDIIDVIPLPGRPQTNRKLKLLLKEEMRGTISALGELRGNLVISVGSKIFVRSFSNNDSLISIAFMDCQSWVRSLTGFKNYLLIGDLINSIWFAGFQEDGPTKVQVIGRDYHNRLPVEYTDLVVRGQQMQILAADSHGNMHFFQYAPRDVHSSSGLKLMRRGEYNLRSRITGVKRLVVPSTAAETVGENAVTPLQQQVCMVATEAGSVYAVTIIPEKMFKRLHRINTQLVHGIPPLAGLNPREYRSVPLNQRQHQAPRRTVLDGDLLVPFYAHGPISRQREAAQRDGTSADRVLRDIVDAELKFAFF
ncbi:mRNA cleavage and polyadenylation factor subunit [Coemansia sp. RSA 487]|nr:mRNA cleavage and polyadenylation factor subunit [Coemansia sp. RSA 487]